MWVEVAGGRLYVETAGRGVPLLLLHGWSLDHRIFEPQIRYLERFFRVVAFDRRGFGRSEAPPDLRLELDDIDRVVEALGLGTLHLLGMSQGARIALRFAVTRPARLRSLIVQAPAVDGIDPGEAESERIPIDAFAVLARAGKMDEVRRRWLAHPMMALGAGHAEARRRVEAIVADWQGKDLLDDAAARRLFPHDVLDALSRFGPPCLILTGAHETAARREHARRLLELLPRGREVVLEHSGHLGNLTEERVYNRSVAAFCAGVDHDLQGQEALDDANRSVRN
jgi:pimeloyl-ACP methyl ester carboxylesterase